jgi:hypothetical protein
MSPPGEPILSDDDMVRYLLGLLLAEATNRLDEQSIVDAGTALRLCMAEHDLVDSYVRGTLEGDLLRRFEQFYLASEYRRRKVRLARNLLAAVDRLARGERDDLREN